MRSVIYVNPLFDIEREPCGEDSIIRRVNYGVYICTCSVISDEYIFKTKRAFFYDIHVKPLHQSKCCEALIDHIADAPIFVFDEYGIETKLNLRHALKTFFGGLCIVEYVYKITPC